MARYATKGNKRRFRRKQPEGQIRQSQMVTTFGPGSMVDLVDRAVVIGGLEHWDFGNDGFRGLDDARLRTALLPRLKALDASLDLDDEDYFRMPPACDSKEPDARVGIRSLEFPRWFVCQGCRRLARAHDAFEKVPESRKRQGYQHACGPGIIKHATVPVRFVAACRNGHLAEFPWIAFAHPDGACARPELYLEEGATGDVSAIRVRCRTCNAPPRSMSDAAFLPFPCRGERPWLGGNACNDTCAERLELLVRTASDAYFSQVVSALRLPEPEPDALTLRLRQPDVWKAVRKVETVEDLQTLTRLQDVVASAASGHPLDKVVQAISRERNAGEHEIDRPLRTAEYARFQRAPNERPGSLAPRDAAFAAFRIPDERADLPSGLRSLVIVPELREVRVQVSFTRFDSITANLQGEFDYTHFRVRPAALTLPTGNEKWLPAAEIRGEGLFLELDREQTESWERRPAVRDRAESLRQAFEADGRGGDFPGVRFYLLHSLSHLLLTAISLECGYAASAIRERIYCSPPNTDHDWMAGILLSTGTTGSEGTLGGLVEEGRRLRHHLREAWDFGRLCSNDPVCAAHDPTAVVDDRNLEGAACHGCLYVAECSCERFNRFLDRALVVPTIGNSRDLAYFRNRP